ncbi:non-specific serine/threonine protein kinase [Ranunculus cassubicifolius]
MSLAPYVLVHLLFLSQLDVHSAKEFVPLRDCWFSCGRLGKVGPPFSNTTNPKCGIFVINCTEAEPRVKFYEQGKWYAIKYLNYLSKRIEIHDQEVQTHLVSNHCDLLQNFTELVYLKRFSEQLSPFLSFNISESPPIFRCARHQSKIFNTSHNYTSCNDSVLYYDDDKDKKLPSLSPNQSNRCSVIDIPSTIPPDSVSNNLTLLRAANIIIDWKVLLECEKCFGEGGQCLSKQNKDFQCRNMKGANVRRKILVGVGAGVTSVLLSCIAYIIHHRCRRNRSTSSPSLISQRLSRDDSLNPDTENGSIYFKTPIFSYKELDEATNHFDESKELGDGGFGTVYHGELRDGRVVAVKRLFENSYKRVEQFMNEIEILSLLRHQNLVFLYGCTSRHCRELLLVYEYVPNGTIADHIHGERAKENLLTWPIRMSIAIETADALAYLHTSEIIHRDVKSNNILLDNNFHVKVADFGLSRLFPTDVTHVSTAPQGTPGYVDPEYYLCYQLNTKSDVYSFGVVLVELISSKKAVDIHRHRHDINLANMAVNRIQQGALHELLDPNLGYETDYEVRTMMTLVAELAFRCLQQEKDMRPCMTEVLEVLRGIASATNNKTDDMDVSAAGRLLKHSQPLSPDAITDKWPSGDTTPNTSG